MGPADTAQASGERDALQRLEDRFQLLSETLRSFAEATSAPALLLETIVRRTAAALGDFCGIMLVSEDGQRLADAASFDQDSASLQTLRHLAVAAPLRLDGGHPLVRCLHAGRPLVMTDFGPEALRARVARPEDLRAAIELKISGMLVAPLRALGKSIGTLSILRHGAAAKPFVASDLQLAQCLADHAALAINNAHLFEHAERELAERRRAEDRLRLLTDLSRQFAAATHDFQSLLDLLARRLGEIIGDGCIVRLVGSGGGWLESVGSAYHPDPALVASLLSFMHTLPLRVGSTIAGKVAATGRPMVINADDPERIASMVHPNLQSLVLEAGIRGLATVPLTCRGKVIGVASTFHTCAGRSYGRDDLSLLEDVVSHAALAISNARLFADSQRELAEREKAELALQRTEQQLRQSQKMEAVGRLAGGVAHDFNNLLTVVLSYCSLMLKQLQPDNPMRADLEEVMKAGERAAALTYQLLAFSRQQVLEARVVDLNQIFADVERLIRRMLGENVTLRTRFEPQLGLVKGDPGQLEQVIMNLVVNARDAMAQGGTLMIETGNETLDEPRAREAGLVAGRYVKLSVTDSGTGMDAATAQRIFEPFFTTKEKGKGTGLGLSTVFGIVRQTGGNIAVSSEPGRGTTFTILLRRSYEAQSRPPRAIEAGRTFGNETVLLVEDDDQVRTVTKGVLERSGYRVLDASSGAQALEKSGMELAPIELLLTDIMMPQMSGRELAERLLPTRPRMRVLYMSGYTDDALVHGGVLAAKVAFLAKPITPESLLRRVREVLDAAPAATVTVAPG